MGCGVVDGREWMDSQGAAQVSHPKEITRTKVEPGLQSLMGNQEPKQSNAQTPTEIRGLELDCKWVRNKVKFLDNCFFHGFTPGYVDCRYVARVVPGQEEYKLLDAFFFYNT